MSEAFLLSCYHQIIHLSLDESPKSGRELADQVMNVLIHQAGIESTLIENIIWGGEVPNQNIKNIPLTQIKRPGLSGLQALFFAQRAVTSGDMQIVAAGGLDWLKPGNSYNNRIIRQLLGGGFKDKDVDAYSHNINYPTCGAAAFILASTQIIGSLNLVPTARLAGLVQTKIDLRTVKNSFDSIIEKILHVSGIQLQDIDFFSIDAVWFEFVSNWLVSAGVNETKIIPDSDFPLMDQTGEAEGVILLSRLMDTLGQNNRQWGLILQIGYDFSVLGMVVERI